MAHTEKCCLAIQLKIEQMPEGILGAVIHYNVLPVMVEGGDKMSRRLRDPVPHFFVPSPASHPPVTSTRSNGHVYSTRKLNGRPGIPSFLVQNHTFSQR